MGGKTMSARRPNQFVHQGRFLYSLTGASEALALTTPPETMWVSGSWEWLLGALIPGYTELPFGAPEGRRLLKEFGVMVATNLQDIIIKCAIRDGDLVFGETSRESISRLVASKSLPVNPEPWDEYFLPLVVIHPEGFNSPPWTPPTGEVIVLDFRDATQTIKSLHRHQLILVEKISPEEARWKEPAHRDR
jgi:hypothetical protein